MKRYILALAAIILVTGMVFAGLSKEEKEAIKTGGVLSVSDIQTDPEVYKGTITVAGVVARVSRQNRKLFTLIDTAEAKHCKSTGCAKFYLPVSYAGAVPKEWDEVKVTGQIVDTNGLVFQAAKLELLGHISF